MIAEMGKPAPYEVPEGGLASFLTATEGEWSDEALDGADTDYTIEMASMLAGYGREGDTALAHVAPGETVVPLEVFDADPELKNRLFSRMREMGLEPERYIVGSELNSLNPTTGQPEFFLKKLFKGVKKAVKGVVKVIKKVAPIALAVIGGMALGPLGAGLGSGIGTLIQGGSLKDALKSGLISGITAGVVQGIGQGFSAASSGSATGLGNVGEFASGFGSSVSEGLSGGYLNQFTTGLANITGSVAGGATAVNPITGEPMAASSLTPGAETGLAPISSPQGIDVVGNQLTTTNPITGEPMALSSMTGVENVASGTGAIPIDTPAGLDVVNGELVAGTGGAAPAEPGFLQKGFDFLKGASDPSQAEVFASSTYKGFLSQGFSPSEAFVAAQKELAPSLLAKYGPMALAGLGVMGVAGGFETPKTEVPMDAFGGKTGWDYLALDPSRYGIAQPGSNFTPVGAATGGAITSFPRKNGPIYGPGTETSDDVPAMLSDGEFVMTAQAVRGAGGGDRQVGMQRMYDIMRKFEGGAVRG
jgi:hypothetical protein